MALAPQNVRTFFVTSVTANRRRLFQVTRNAELQTDVLRNNQAKGRFELHAYVIMPDHIHLLLTPSPDISLEKAIQFVKGSFSFRLRDRGEVWEKGFNEHRIKDAHDYRNHVEYIEQNPVNKHLVMSAKDYPHSSAADYLWLAPAPDHLKLAGAKAPPLPPR